MDLQHNNQGCDRPCFHFLGTTYVESSTVPCDILTDSEIALELISAKQYFHGNKIACAPE